jgi:hypothetical protein
MQPLLNRCLRLALLGLIVLMANGLPAWAQTREPAQRPRVIIGPSAVYGRGYSPGVARSAGFTTDGRTAVPGVVPNYSNLSYQPAYAGASPFAYGTATPYGVTVYGPAYPGYGYGYGTGYGALGYNFNYPGMTVGYGLLGASYAPAGTGYVAPTWYYQQMQGFYRR